MARKLFIVAPDKEQLYRSLRSALSNEPDVEVFYDRRKYPQPKRRALEERLEAAVPLGCSAVRSHTHMVVRKGRNLGLLCPAARG